eukprot:m.139830 g.139830  ORF g.139830 m.139830 type:complete len:238 (+) comp30084_c1_seq4:571-1284(+)
MPVRSAAQLLISAAEVTGKAASVSSLGLRRSIKWYADHNARAPIRTQALTSCFVGGFGDLLMQRIEHKLVKSSSSNETPMEYDLARTARFAVYRLFLFGPALAVFVRSMERGVKAKGKAGVAIKIALDQLAFQPVSLCVFYFSMATMEGQSPSQAVDRATNMLLPTLKVNWPFWIPVHVITFSYIPASYRVAWISFLQVGWAAVMSHLNQRAIKEETMQAALQGEAMETSPDQDKTV